MPIRDIPDSSGYEKPARAKSLYDGPPLEEREASIEVREFELHLPTLRAVLREVIEPAISETQIETILKDTISPGELENLIRELDDSLSHIARQGGQIALLASIKLKMNQLITEAEEQ